MGLKFYFNKSALEALAKELRRASWGITVVAAAGGIKLDNAIVLVVGATFWTALQLTAVVLESLKDDEEEGGNKCLSNKD